VVLTGLLFAACRLSSAQAQNAPAEPGPPIQLDQPQADDPRHGRVVRIGPDVPVPPGAQPPVDAQPLPVARALPEALQEPQTATIIEAVTTIDQDVELHVNRSKLYRLSRELSPNTILSYDNERVVDVQLLGDPQGGQSELRYLNLFGVGYGEATVNLIDRERNFIQTLRVRVTIDELDLEKRLNRTFPGADLRVRQIAQNVILEGAVPDAKTMADVLELVRSSLRITGQSSSGSLTGAVFGSGGGGGPASAGGTPGAQPVSVNSGTVPGGLTTQGAAQPGLNIINRVHVPGPRQVMLRVKIAELNRTALRQIGANFQRVTDGDVIASVIGNIAAIGITPGAVTPGPDTQLFGIFDEGNFNLFLNALRRNNLARVLAEPTLVTLDGQPAQFLAGGEFPYPVAQTGSTVGSSAPITIQFRNFGAVLQFLPFIQDDDSIRLDVEPVFSELNFATGTAINGTTVPGLNVRSARTVVQMREGQTLAIAGLFSTRTRGTTNRVPLLGDLPGVGSVFSKNEIQTEESELVVLVTPVLVEAVDHQVAPGPGEDLLEPNDLEFYFLGRLEGRTGHVHRSTIHYLDPANVMKHFRSENQWVVGPHGFAE
jgi:pilus assembly protein CpaC